MATDNGRLTPYDYSSNLRAPEEKDEIVSHTVDRFQQIIGDLRYLTDITRTDIGYVTYKLGMVMHTPTKRHCRVLYP